MQNRRFRQIALAVAGLGVIAGAAVAAVVLASGQRPADPGLENRPQIYTPAHRTLLGAVREFFDIQPARPSQPIAFSHKKHLANGMKCVDCHTGVDKGPDAGLPSIKFCMMCHQAIDTDNPEIKKIAAYYAKGQDIPWRRVYWYYPDAHVKFWHAPHIRAGVSCKTCHGDMRQQTVAVRSVNLTMGFCIDCHRAKKASLDCTTCHF
jgi:Cytochrome c7 and related cytochrome c